MPTFIDESGDTGPVRDGGKPYFRLAAVWMPSHEEAEAFRREVRLLRESLGLRSNYEFKFSKTHTNPEQRAGLFAAALAQGFRFAVSLIDKTDNDWSTAGSREIHWACATELAALLRPRYAAAESTRATRTKESVTVDDNSDGSFLDIIKSQFRGLHSAIYVGRSMIGKVGFKNSASDEMLQLVDMVCGAAGAHADGRDATWFELIAERDVARSRNVERG